MDKSNEHLLTTKSCTPSRVVRRIPDGNGNVEECDDQATRAVDGIERSTEERRDSSAAEDKDRTGSSSRRSHARKFR